MSKTARILTSLVAAVPAGWFLYTFFTGGVAGQFAALPLGMQVGIGGAGLASTILALVPLLAAAGLFAGGPKKPKPAKAPKAKKVKKPKKGAAAVPEDGVSESAEVAPEDSGEFADDDFASDEFESAEFESGEIDDAFAEDPAK